MPDPLPYAKDTPRRVGRAAPLIATDALTTDGLDKKERIHCMGRLLSARTVY